MKFVCYACFAIPWKEGADANDDGVEPAGRDPSGGNENSLRCVRCGTGLKLDGPFARWYQD